MADREVGPTPVGLHHEALIRREWPRFAMHAYAEFLAHGRGAVLLTPAATVMQSFVELVSDHPVVSYVTVAMVEQASPGDPDIALLASYDPETEAVFFVNHGDGLRHTTWRYGGGGPKAISPAAAFAAYARSGVTN